MALQRSKGSKSDLDPASKFRESGQTFKAKLYGMLRVQEARGDDIIQTALAKFRQETKSSKDHKRKILIRITLDGVGLEDAHTREVIALHLVRQISFLARDKNDTRAFGYIVSREDNTFQLYGIKTEGKAEVPLLAIKDMFDIVYQQETLLQRVCVGSTAGDAITPNDLSRASSQSGQSYGAVGGAVTGYQRNQSSLGPNAPPDDDDELAAAIALSIATAEQEKQEREVINESILEESPGSNEAQFTSPVEDDDEQPPPYDKLNIISGYESHIEEPPPTIEQLQQLERLDQTDEQHMQSGLQSAGGGGDSGYEASATLDVRTRVHSEPQLPDEDNAANNLWPQSTDNAWGNVEWPSGSTEPAVEHPFRSSVWPDQPSEAATNDLAWPDPNVTAKTPTANSNVWGFADSDTNTIDDQLNEPTLNIGVDSPKDVKKSNIPVIAATASSQVEPIKSGTNKLTLSNDNFDPFAESTTAEKEAEKETADSHDPWAQSGAFELEETNKMDDAFADNPFEINISSAKKHRKSGSFSSTSSVPQPSSPKGDTGSSRNDAALSHNGVERDRPSSKISNRSVSPFESDPFFTQPSPTKLPALTRKQQSKPSEPSIPEAVDSEPIGKPTTNSSIDTAPVTPQLQQVSDTTSSNQESTIAFDPWASSDPFAEVKFEPFPIENKEQESNDPFAPQSGAVGLESNSVVGTHIDPFAAEDDPFSGNQSIDPFGSIEGDAAPKSTDPFTVNDPFTALDPSPAKSNALPNIISNDPFTSSNEPTKANDLFAFKTNNIEIDLNMEENDTSINNLDFATDSHPASSTEMKETGEPSSTDFTMQANVEPVDSFSSDSPTHKIAAQLKETSGKAATLGNVNTNQSNSDDALLEPQQAKAVDHTAVKTETLWSDLNFEESSTESNHVNSSNDNAPTDAMTQSLENALMSPPPSAPAPTLSFPASDTPALERHETTTPTITISNTDEPQTKNPPLPSRTSISETEIADEDLPPPSIPPPTLKVKAKAPPPIPARQKAPGRTTPAVPERQSIPVIPPRPDSVKLS